MTSRRAFLVGAGAGVAGTLAAGGLWNKVTHDPAQPPFAVEHATNSYWLDDAGYYNDPIRPPLNVQSYDTDILIIGGGFTGMSTAWHLLQTRPDAKVTLIDAAKCGFGASGRNGGWCMGHNMIAPSGAPDLVADLRLVMSEGVSIVKGLVNDHGIDCDFTPASIVDLTDSSSGPANFDANIDACDRLGIESKRLSHGDIKARYHSDFFTAGAEYFDGSAAIQPGKLGHGLRRLLLNSDVEIFEGTKVLRIEGGARPRVQTDFGFIHAEKVVLATNAYSRSLGEFGNRTIPAICSMTTTAPLSDGQLASTGFKRGELLGLTGVGSSYYFALVTPDHRIVIGGGHPWHYEGSALHSGTHSAETAFIENYLTRELWPTLEGLPITHRWGGNVCVTRDFCFSMGHHPGHENVLYSLGYSGEGVSTTFAAGKTLAQLLGGQESDLTRTALVDRPLGWIPGEPFRSLIFGAINNL